MNKAPLKDRLKYSFENTLSKGTVAIIGWLAVISVLIIVIAAAVIFFAGIDQPEGNGMNFMEAAWQSFLHTIDSGTVAGDNGWTLRILMLLVTIGGIFIVSTLIGTLTSGLESKLDELRKGRSRVLEEDHTLILGWSSKIYSIISEIIIANENRSRARIVIMADMDKVEMEDEIKMKFPNTKNTKIICRTGSPLDLTDLDVVNPNGARSIIILSPDESQNPDTEVIKSILALTNNPSRKKESYHIVAEIKNEENIEAAELVGNKEAVLVLSSDLIAKVTAQTCRQSGLSVVYTELLDFDGAEIYFKEEQGLVGKTYKDSLFAYRDSTVMGIFKKDGEVLINPPMNSILSPGDQVIAVSMDDDTIKLDNNKVPEIDRSIIVNAAEVTAKKERTLVLGWNERGISILKELDNYVAPGSETTLVAEVDKSVYDLGNLEEIKNQTITFLEGNINDRKTLDGLKIETFDHIIILCYEHLDIQQADAKTLIALLHLRNISEKCGKDFSIVSEMLDIKNRELAEVTKADDFIVSDKLVSLMLSQLSENKELKKVFDQLFASEGSEIYLKPVTNYIVPDKETDFYTLLESAAAKNETAIGYRIQAQSNDPSKAYGVIVNPDKSQAIKFGKNDKLIVLSEN